jgi:hypothetical protein
MENADGRTTRLPFFVLLREIDFFCFFTQRTGNCLEISCKK